MGKMSVKLVKAGVKGPLAKAVAGAPITSFQIIDNQNDIYTVTGVDSVNNPVDISAVATLTPAPSSDAPTVLSVDAPTGMSFKVTALGPLGTANVLATATWNDGSLGPFSFTLPTTVAAGPAGAIEIVPGTPTAN